MPGHTCEPRRLGPGIPVKTAFVTVYSEVGRRCRLQLPSLSSTALAVDPPSVSVEVNASTGVVEIGLQAGGEGGMYGTCNVYQHINCTLSRDLLRDFVL